MATKVGCQHNDGAAMSPSLNQATKDAPWLDAVRALCPVIRSRTYDMFNID